jgi:hypothetical protein
MHTVSCRLFYWVLFTTLGAAFGIYQAEAQAVTVTTLSGERVSGELSVWSADGGTLRTEGVNQTFSASDLLILQFAPQAGDVASSATILTLTDDTRLEIASIEMQSHTATVKSRWATEPLLVPSTVIELLQFPTEQPLDWLAEWEKADFSEDVLIVNKKGTGKCDFLAGVIQEVTPTLVQFTWEGDTLPVKRSKLAGLSLFHSQAPPTTVLLCRLQLTSGEILAVQTLELATRNLRVTTVSGLRLQIPVSELARADYSVGKLEYLSDCKPVLQTWTPLIGLPGDGKMLQSYGAPRRDASWQGTPLALSWPATADGKPQLKTFAKGLAIRSRTELEYRVPKSMNKFLATAGIDPETANQGNVVLQIELDGTVVFEQTLEGSREPVGIEVDVANRQRMKIVVDYGDNLDLGDHLHLAEARWSK